MPTAKRKAAKSKAGKSGAKADESKSAVAKFSMDEEEVAANRYIRMMDPVLMVPLIGAYYGYGLLHSEHWQNPEHAGLFSHGSPGEQPMWLRVVAVIGALAAVYSLGLHAFEMAPVLKVSASKYKVMQIFGRWTFLTRWCLAFQCVHHICCAIIAFDPGFWPLEGIVPGCAPVSGAIGCFVTVQFFTLVYSSPRFNEEILAMKKIGFPDLWYNNMVTHGLCMPLAIFDAVFFQPGVMQWIPITQMIFAVAIWCVTYLCVIFFNYYKTGEYPYQVLDKNGTNPIKWASFVAVQVALICLFDAMLRTLRWATPRVW